VCVAVGASEAWQLTVEVEPVRAVVEVDVRLRLAIDRAVDARARDVHLVGPA
jgi:hypothetical protein